MAVNKGDSIGIDIDRLVSSIEDMMPHDLLISSKCCIFKTPSILYRHNEKAYIPDAFSIGPFHHGSPNLKATEKIKVKYLQALISRSYYPELLRTLIKSIMEVEKEARECYAEAIDYNAEELVKILVIDGCFIIELFRKKTYPRLIGLGDPIFSRSNMLQCLFHDLILLENQVPWMVLERLFYLTKDSNDENPLIILALDFLSGIHFSQTMPPLDQVINLKDIKHFVDLFWKISIISSTDPPPDQCINIECIKRFVDLFRKLATLSSTHLGKLTTSSITLFRNLSTLSSSMFRISSTEKKKERLRGWELLPSATSLTEYGIKFKRGTSSKTILEVKFNDGILEIPPFEIEETTETVFRNLISYEQCHRNFPHSITSYAILLDCLINTSKDIDILCENEIIDNWLNPQDAAQFFNKLYLDTLVNYHYDDLCREVNSFCRRRWPRWRAVLARNYFNTPWAFISTLAAFILLLLTLLQTVYTMKK